MIKVDNMTIWEMINAIVKCGLLEANMRNLEVCQREFF